MVCTDTSVSFFGVNMATEKFHHIMWQAIKNCLGAYNFKNDEEHNANHNRVVRKHQDSALNYDTYEIGVAMFVFTGDVL